MTKRRTIIAAVSALATLTFGLAATGADARSAVKPRVTTSIPTVNTLTNCYSGPNCQRTKNAALPTTTAKPATTTTKPVAIPANAALYVIKNGNVLITACKAGYILVPTANQCVPAPTTTVRTKNAALPTTTQPRTITTPVPILAKPSGSKISTH